LADVTTFNVREVIERGFEAFLIDESGAFWLFHGCCALRVGADDGARLLITDPAKLPSGPWRATPWGEAELAASPDD
jgi:hypothetical protein